MNANTLANFVTGLKTSQLVALYNLTTDKKIKKFADRKTAEKRILSLLAPNGQEEEYRAFRAKYGKASIEVADAELPDLFPVPVPVIVPTDAQSDKAVAAVNAETEAMKKKRGRKAAPRVDGSAPAKQNTPPHLNLRCPVCAYYAKTTPAMLKLARLACPLGHGKLLTAEERGEKRGR
jgi:hypothetical protein